MTTPRFSSFFYFRIFYFNRSTTMSTNASTYRPYTLCVYTMTNKRKSGQINSLEEIDVCVITDPCICSMHTWLGSVQTVYEIAGSTGYVLLAISFSSHCFIYHCPDLLIVFKAPTRCSFYCWVIFCELLCNLSLACVSVRCPKRPYVIMPLLCYRYSGQ